MFGKIVEKRYYIPRDPRTEVISFLTDAPEGIGKRIGKSKWKEIIKQLNDVFVDVERPSIFMFIKNLIIFPALLSKPNSFDNRVEKLLAKINASHRDAALHIEHPAENQYTELEVVLYKRS